MDPKVKEFIDAAKSKERAKFEKERDAHLIRLGLIKEKVRKYSDAYGGGYCEYDKVQKKYYGEFNVPVSVTDEEYEEIKRLTEKKSNEEVTVENGAEKFLGALNAILLIIEIITAIVLIFISFFDYDGGIYFLSGLGVLLVSLISWSVMKVLLNISNNLHQINAKLK